MGVESPLILPETRMATARAGHHRYEWWFSGAPDQADAGAMRLHTTWRVYRDDEDAPLREVHDSYHWIPFGLAAGDRGVRTARAAAPHPARRATAGRTHPPTGHHLRPPAPPGSLAHRPRAEAPDSIPKEFDEPARSAGRDLPAPASLADETDEAASAPPTPPAPGTFPSAGAAPSPRPRNTPACAPPNPSPGSPCPPDARPGCVSRYEDVRELLADPRISADIRRPNFPALGEGEQEIGARLRPFIRTDAPEHTRYRRMLLPEFTVRRIRAMRPAVQAIVDDLLDSMLATETPADFVSLYANAVSTSVICELLGIPRENLEFFRDVTRISGSRSSTAEQVSEALGGLFTLISDLVTQRQEQPGDDLLSRLVVNHLQTGDITLHELLSTVGITINAGRETSTNMIALSTLLLLERPDLMEELRADPSLMPAAVDELLRVMSIADSIPLRVAAQDIEISGRTIPADDGVIGLLAGANHDPEQFPDPDQVDFHRPENHHVAFGYGVHQCIGQHLARLELEVALETLIRRVPTLRLAEPDEDVEFKHDSATFGIETAAGGVVSAHPPGVAPSRTRGGSARGSGAGIRVPRPGCGWSALPHAGGGASCLPPLGGPAAAGGRAPGRPVPGPGRPLRRLPGGPHGRAGHGDRRSPAPLLDRPYALFGHSMGSAVAWETGPRPARRGAPVRDGCSPRAARPRAPSPSVRSTAQTTTYCAGSWTARRHQPARCWPTRTCARVVLALRPQRLPAHRDLPPSPAEPR